MIPARIPADVIKAIEDELAYQRRRFGEDKQQSVPGFLLIMKEELREAETGWLNDSNEPRSSCMEELVQVVATAIACLANYGTTGNAFSTNDIPSPSRRTPPDLSRSQINVMVDPLV